MLDKSLLKAPVLSALLFVVAGRTLATTYYVGPSGDDGNDGKSTEGAVAKVSTALSKCAADDEVVILKSTTPYPVTATLVLPSGVTVRGETGKPEDVVLRSDGATGHRVFDLSSSTAVVSGLTVENATYSGSFHDIGAGIYLHGEGGTVSNCVIRGCTKTNFNDGGGGIGIAKNTTDALVTHCIVSNCQENGSCRADYLAGGGALVMFSGTVRNCLFVRNVRKTATAVKECFYGTVRVVGGRLENCTIANNSAGSCSGVWATGGTVVNCVIAENATTVDLAPDLPVWAGKASCFTNCVSDGEVPINDWCSVVKSPFVDARLGDWQLAPGTDAVDGGAELDWMAGTTDFYGNDRVRGDAPDIGCSEIDSSAFGAHLELSVDVGLAPVLVVGTVMVANAGDQGVLCEWDWNGDGVYEETGYDLSREHEYADFGQSKLVVRVTDLASGEKYTTAAKVVTVYPRTHFVSKATGVVPTSPYATPQTAAPDLATALAVAAAGGEIVIAADTYTVKAEIDVAKNVRIRGETGHPEDVILHSDGKDHRVFKISANECVLSALTVENATQSGSLGDIGAGIYFYGAGGTVSNCIIRGCTKKNFSNGGGGIGIAAGVPALVTHCIISNCTEAGSDHASYSTCGSAMVLYGGTARNCLFVKNYRKSSPTTASFKYGTVRVKGARLENCTIADNTAGRCAGVWASDSAVVVNCLIANNETLVDQEPDLPVWAGDASCFENCVSDGTNTINGTCRIVDADPFVDAAGGNWQLAPGVQAAIDKGTELGWMSEATDLYGNPRIRGKGPDVGAHEADPNSFAASLKLSSAQGFKPAKVTCAVTVVNGGEQGILCEWDWDGDGTYEESSVTLEAEHVYSSYGAHTIAVRVTDKESGLTATPASLVFSVYPKTMYVGKGEGVTPTPPYDSEETAAPDVATALALAVKDSEIVIAPDIYTVSAAIVVEKGVTIRGKTGIPEDVVLRSDGVNNHRVLELGTKDAAVCGLTVENAVYYGEYHDIGGGVYIYGSGGTLSNCIVRNCSKVHFNDGGGGIGIGSFAVDALVTHCIISNCQENGSAHVQYCGGGGALAMYAGRVRNCLFVRNVRETASPNDFRYGTVRVAGGSLENCTIADNSAGSCAGVWATGGTVVNCVIVGNKTTVDEDPAYPVWAGDPSYFLNCVGEVKVNDSCCVSTVAETYKGFERANYRLRAGSPAVDFGLHRDWMDGATDLLGKPRQFGKKPDAGCYECFAGGLSIIVR